METQSTVTDSASEQVEQALLKPVPPQCEVTPAEVPVKLPVAVEHMKTGCHALSWRTIWGAQKSSGWT